jgi:hypothetical protein
VPLSQFGVVQDHSEQPDAVLVTCFDGAQTLLVFISHEVIDNYFRRQDLTVRQRNLLVMRNLDQLVPVISGRYERGEVSTYASQTGRAYARIDLMPADLEQAPEKLTDSVIDIDAHAGFQGVSSGPPQTRFTPPMFGIANRGFYSDIAFTDVSTQPGSQNTPLPLATTGSDPISSAAPIPSQGAGPHFTIGAGGQIALAPPSELDAVGNDVGRIRQFLPLVRRAADDLAAALNENQFPVLYRNLADYRTAIVADIPEIAWGIVFGLGVRLANAADAAQREIEDRLLSTLEDPAQEALRSLNMLHGSLIMATAEGRELEEQADRLQMTREQVAAFRTDALAIAAELHRAAEVIEPPADRIVTEAAEVIGEGTRAERGTVFAAVTFKHVTIVLVSAATLAAIGGAVGGAVGTALGAGTGTALGVGTTWLGLEGLKQSAAFKAVAAALGKGFDRLHEVDPAKFRELLSQLAPFRRFVTDNQEPLRRIATNTRQMRWMLPYIDFIAPQLDRRVVDMELSFDPNDPECLARVRVFVSGRSWLATSVRVRVRACGDATLQKVMGYVTNIEKQMAAGEWRESNLPDIELTWVGDTPAVEIPASSTKYLNILHVDETDNRLSVWGRHLPPSLEDFLSGHGTYRFTVSVLAQGLTRQVQCIVIWQGEWDKLQVSVAP